MELAIKILLALLIAVGIATLATLVVVLLKLKTLLENLNATTRTLNTRLPEILNNITDTTKELKQTSNQLNSYLAVIKEVTEFLQSLLSKAKFVFSSDEVPSKTGVSETLIKLSALVKAIKAAFSKFKT